MSVKLVWITPEAENTIVYCGRVSNPANQENFDTSEKLIRYLINHKHFSPFEMAAACIEINTTRDIARQILRHRSFAFQEFSQRYADVNAIITGPTFREARIQDEKNRQASHPTDDPALISFFEQVQKEVYGTALARYDQALVKGIAKEQARALLPEGLTPSRMYMQGSIRSWMHYLQTRLGNGTQKEHEDIAWQIFETLFEHIPTIMSTTMETR